MTGERISWQGANKVESGVVEMEAKIKVGDEEMWNYGVQLDNGKFVIVNEKSIIEQ